MPKEAKELSAIEVKRLSTPGLHAAGGVAGLYVQVGTGGAKSWILRIRYGNRRRDIGLGSYPTVGLSDARQKARQARDAIEAGRDPIFERIAAKSALAATRGREMTFEDCARRFIETKSAEWTNPKHAKQWSATLETYAYPHVGRMRVADVALPHVVKVLESIWTTKTETATRLRGRIEAVLDYATVRGFRDGDNPARWRGHLDKVLPAPKKIAKVQHHEAMPYAQLGAFIIDLRKREALAARALEFLILTAARSGEIRGARWDEIDFESETWTIPAARMKAKKEHRIPLSPAAMDVLRNLSRLEDSPLVFPAARGGTMSDMVLTELMRRMKQEAVPHGFRSSFRDWAAERTNYPREIAEAALAHQLEDKVEAAYRRSDFFEKRRRMMEDWAKFINTPAPAGEIVPIRGAA